MKKSLVALAVLAASGAVMAQSSVTLYGLVDLGLTSYDNGTDTVTAIDGGTNVTGLNGNRWGLKGSEDLGGGLKAIFTFESGFTADDGKSAQGGRLFGRQSYVGLQGGFGTVKMGRLMNPIYQNTGTLEAFADALAGDSAYLLNYQGSRTDNTVSYLYSASGFRGEVQYGFGEVPGDTSASRMLGLVLGYKQGPIDVVLTYEKKENPTNTDSEKVIALGGNYDFGVAKVFLSFEQETGFGAVDRDHVLLGVSAPLGGGTVMASYINRSDNVGPSLDADLYAIGYKYPLSKRTYVYGSYGSISNDALANVKVAVAGDTAKLFGIGLRHAF